MATIIFVNHSYFHNISISLFALYAVNIMNFFSAGLIFTPDVYVYVYSRCTSFTSEA